MECRDALSVPPSQTSIDQRRRDCFETEASDCEEATLALEEATSADLEVVVVEDAQPMGPAHQRGRRVIHQDVLNAVLA